MKYVAIDIETTGLDESYCQILEIGAVIENGFSELVELPSLRMRFYYDRIVGEPFAINMNARMIAEIPARQGGGEWMNFDTAASRMREFFETYFGIGFKVTVAGKNYGMFDSRFLNKLPRWAGLPIHRRVIDVGNLYLDRKRDLVIPDTAECIKRAGLDWPTSKLHNAIDDCKLVIALIRKLDQTNEG